ncbi:MAG: oligopeptidase B, partial [Enterobacterales bacterium]
MSLSTIKVVISALLISAVIGCSDDSKQIAETEAETKQLEQDSMTQTSDKNMPPKAEKVEHLMSIHGHQRNDQYYWLRDDTRKSEQVINYLNAENDYTKDQLSHTEDLQKKLFEEMTARLEPNEESVPVFDKGYWYWSKFQEGQDYPIHIRQKGSLEAAEEVLLDQNKRAEGHEYYSLADMDISQNQKLMGISEDTVSRRRYDIRIKNLQTEEFFPEVIENTSGQIVWANDNKTLFYVRKHPTTLLPYQVYRHELGTSPEKDVLVYEEEDTTFYTSIYKTRSEKYIGIVISSTMNSEYRFVSATTPTDAFTMFLTREKDHLFDVEHIGNNFYIQSDFEAMNERLWKVEESKIGTKDHWQEVLAHREDTLIQNFELFNDYMVVNERVNGLEKLRIRDYTGKLIEEVIFNDAAYNAGIGNNPDPASRIIRYGYSSMNTPSSVYDYHLDKGTSELKKQDKVIGDFHPEQYQSERIMIEARDGKKVPVSIVYRKDKFKKDGTNPLLNYAYGSYGHTVDPGFSISRLSLLDRGVVFAISHIRGSKMLGRKWYEDGKKLTKMNTFTDFNDATKSLVKQGYANAKQVYAMGGSAGGMLMGGIINMQPELYHGVIAAVPFVDVVTTMLDESIPLTTGEFDEWGNPKNKEYFDYMLSYSPYDQVKAQNYPNLLVTTGLHDSQVQYWEPAKWVAKLRDMKTDGNVLLLDTD